MSHAAKARSTPDPDEVERLRQRRVELELELHYLERRHAEAVRALEELREVEERFKRLADRADDLLFVLRLQPMPHFAYVNAACKHLFGCEQDLFYANPDFVFDLVHDEDRPKLKARLSARVASDDPLVLRWHRRDGSLLWTEMRVKIARDETGRPESIEGNLRDITQRKLAEEDRERLLGTIENERRWLEAVFDRSPIGIVLVKLDGASRRYIYNERIKSYYGEGIDWAQGPKAYVARIRHADGRAVKLKELPSIRALLGEKVVAEQFTILHSSGSQHPVLSSAAPIRDPMGRILGAAVTFEDVSTLKELERLKEEWTSIIAHDLRQPITTMLLQGSFLVQLPDVPESVKKIGKHVFTSAEQLNRLVGDLLDASRIEAKNLSLDLKQIDLRLLLEDVVARFQPQHPDRSIRLRLPDRAVEVDGDPGRLEQVFVNLLSNAVKYGYERSEIEVRVELEGEHVHLAFINEGQGLSPEAAGRLFNRFERAKWSREKGIKGIGLGLYITKGLVEAHSGSIWVESEAGKKTSFHIRIPVRATRSSEIRGMKE